MATSGVQGESTGQADAAQEFGTPTKGWIEDHLRPVPGRPDIQGHHTSDEADDL
jgi:hypothetical protein